MVRFIRLRLWREALNQTERDRGELIFDESDESYDYS